MTLRTLLDRFDLLMDTPESVPKLRRFILQMAVRGRFSDRRASDESVELLLERMEDEKERLDAAGEYKYQKTMPPIEEDDIPFSFALPDGWTWVRLGNLGKVYGGGTPKKSKAEYWGGDIPWVSPKDMNEAVIQSTEDQITQKGLNESSAKLVPPNSLLIVGRSGILERKLPVGVTGIECTANQDLKVLTPFVPGMARYIRLILKGFESYILDELVKTGTTVRSLKYTEFQLQPYPLPPLQEQQRIVQTVDRLMDECDALEEQQERARNLQVQVGTAATEALQSAEDASDLRPAWERVRKHFGTVTATPEGVDALRQTILQLAVQGRLTEHDPGDTPADVLLEQIQQQKQRLYKAGEIRKPKDSSPVESEPFQLPSDWQWSRVNDICEIRGGIQKTPDREPQDNPYPYLRVANVQRNRLLLDEIKHFELYEGDLEKWRLQYGDILVVEGNGSESEIGRCAMWREEIPNCVHQNHLIRCRPIKTEMAQYIMLYLNSSYGIEEMKQRAVTTSGLYNLSVGKIRSIAIPIPPLKEQKRILQKVAPLRSVCNDLEELLSESNERGEQLIEAALREVNVEQGDTTPEAV